MTDNDQKTELDVEDNKIIQAQLEEPTEGDVEVKVEVEACTDTETVKQETIIIKKGGFVSFLSILLSLTALAASAYLYLQSQKPKSSIDGNQWQTPIADLNSKLSKGLKQQKAQIDQFKKKNEALLAQINLLQTKVEQQKPNLADNNNQVTGNLVDYSKEFAAIEAKINQNKQLYETVSAEVNQAQSTQQQTINNLKSTIAQQATKPVETTSINPNQFKFEMSENLLQAAVIQLEVHQNLNKSTGLLNQAASQVKQIPGQTFANFAFEIEQTIVSLAKIKSVDIDSTNQQITQLKSLVSSLAFETPKVKEKTESSWFDKLVVIRKIDDASIKNLTAAEQMMIYSQLSNYFDLLKFALLSQNQQKWNSTIAQIKDSLTKYFPKNSDSIQNQLTALAELKLSTEYPNISSLLTTFQQYRNRKQQLTSSKE